ncbi:MAG: hypothetical protein GXO72_02785 [Caldiserica bacterium]|nr:hypothetical protein [Caldisericota bacterium]
MPRLIDAARDFIETLRRSFPDSPGEFVELWERFYRERFPELYRKQVGDYRATGEDPRVIVGQRIHPRLLEGLPAMEAALKRLPGVWEWVLARAEEVLGFREEVLGVAYVGIGCGAGWATEYEGVPAVLFGLETIAELGWHSPERLEGLCAHELGHVIHRAWRGEPLEPLEERPAGLLYTEGFAQRLEGLIVGREGFHQAEGADWAARCEALLPDIARAYLLRLDDGDVREFFGSWFDFRGVRYTGYFLGHRFIRDLERRGTLRWIASLREDEVEGSARAFLRGIAG